MKAPEKRHYWREMVSKSNKRTGSLESFCKTEGIGLHALRYWKTRFGDEALPMKRSQFVPVQIVDEPAAHGLPDPKWLAALIFEMSTR